MWLEAHCSPPKTFFFEFGMLPPFFLCPPEFYSLPFFLVAGRIRRPPIAQKPCLGAVRSYLCFWFFLDFFFDSLSRVLRRFPHPSFFLPLPMSSPPRPASVVFSHGRPPRFYPDLFQRTETVFTPLFFLPLRRLPLISAVSLIPLAFLPFFSRLFFHSFYFFLPAVVEPS